MLHLPMLAKHRFLLPVLVVLAIVLVMSILKKTKFGKINLFLNLLLLSCITVDLFSILKPGGAALHKSKSLVSNNMLAVENLPVPADKPDVYFLLFDSYPATQYLSSYLHYDNSEMEKKLLARNFRVILHPKSNYNRTAFSMASELNFEHFQSLNNGSTITPQHYTQALLAIQNGLVPRVFEHLGYAVHNLSVFDIGATSPIFKEGFLSMPGLDMLLFNTCPARIRSDIGWKFVADRMDYQDPGRLSIAAIQKVKFARFAYREFTRVALDSVVQLAGESSLSPKFVYAHLMLPHPPFFYDENGRPGASDSILPLTTHSNPRRFLQYLQYTNRVMLAVVDSIRSKTAGKAVIIVQSDHGSIDFDNVPITQELRLQNFSSFYFPDRAYELLYDSLSNVNTFPILFNKYFKTAIPLQNDSFTVLK
jgi:hypothetical protein